MGLYIFVVAIFLSSAAFCVFVWAVKDGQFKDNEDIGNRPLESEEKYI